jgi:hypothetical protein
MEKVAERQAVQGSGMAGAKKYYSDSVSLQEILGNWVRVRHNTGAERARCAQVAESLVRSGAGSHDPAAGWATRGPLTNLPGLYFDTRVQDGGPSSGGKCVAQMAHGPASRGRRHLLLW